MLVVTIPPERSAIMKVVYGSFSHNTFPNAWKMAEVIPIQKSGDYEDPANTRPVSLLPIVSKVLLFSVQRFTAETLEAVES